MQRTDYHTHTPLCRHAYGSAEAFVKQALALGLSTYGIADHAPMPKEMEPYDDWRMLCAELPLYADWIEQARAMAGNRLQILTGLECDWVPGISPWIKQLRSEARCDYLIGSVHYLPRLGAVDDVLYAEKNITGSTEEDWYLYWQAIVEMVKSGLFDIAGHIDLVKIWGRKPQGNLMSYYTPALDALQESRMAVEINTAGWHKHCAEQYPAIPLLQELLKRRIPIVINSDAHYPEHVSRGWEQGIALLRELTDNSLQQFDLPAANNPNTILKAYGPL